MTQGLVRIIVNPISGRGQDPRFVRELVRHLSLRGFPVEVTTTRRPGHAHDLARDAPDQARCVVSIGGDGTHREVLSGLVGRPVPACIVPSGTENVLGRTFRLTGTLADTAALIQHGRRLSLDVGLAGDRPFVMFSGVGFDAEVTQEVHRRRRGPILRAAYYAAIMRKWWRYAFPPITVIVDGHQLADDAGVVFVANTPLYGGRLRLVPGAKGDDGLLDVVCFRGPSRWHVLAHYLRTRAGRHVGHPLVAIGRGKRIEVTCAERRLPVQVDGDVLAATPLVYTVRPRAVRLLVRPDGARLRRREGG
ncbi:MAG TPA: diacylglycerol kinase family protein [Phycisphaerae bacterium]|nr:diacylglycerol kinase family protein [Phycisphaerae bacterium]